MYNDEFGQEQCKSCIDHWPWSSAMRGMASCKGVYLASSDSFIFYFTLSTIAPMCSYTAYFMITFITLFKHWKKIQTVEGRQACRNFLLALQSLLPAMIIIFSWWYSVYSVFNDWIAFGFAAFFSFFPSIGCWRLLVHRRVDIWFVNHLNITNEWIWLTCTPDGNPGLPMCTHHLCRMLFIFSARFE